MIEALIDYIQKKGYSVSVAPGILLIRKKIGSQTAGLNWAVSQFDLKYVASVEVLFRSADYQLARLETGILEQERKNDEQH
jgi:hypothetical protein